MSTTSVRLCYLVMIKDGCKDRGGAGQGRAGQGRAGQGRCTQGVASSSAWDIL